MSINDNKIIILGPCALESFQQMELICHMAKKLGITYVRAQVFKPRTSPTSFQGTGIEGISIIEKLKKSFPTLRFVCEVCSAKQFDLLKDTMDFIQIGARNMQNFELLKYINQNYNKDKFKGIILKRGFANTTFEWIEAAKYLEGENINKENIILCERGSRSITSSTGVHLDFISALEAKAQGFKVIIDPSHGTKKREFVLPLASAALAMNFDGLMIEVHPEPEKSVSDKDQAISIEDCENFFT